MSRTKNTAIKQMSPDNAPSENLKLAQVGEMWEETGFTGAFMWRLALAFCKYGNSEVGRKEAESKRKNRERFAREKGSESIEPAAFFVSYKAQIQKEIGEEVGRAIENGDWRYLESLAKATKFVAESWDWQVNSIYELTMIKSFDLSKFEPPDRLRMVMVRDYHLSFGDIDAVKKSRKAFMEHVALKLGREKNEAFAKTFDRACKELGIRWPRKGDHSYRLPSYADFLSRKGKVDNSSRGVSKT